MMYILYRMGFFLAMHMPLNVSYAVATVIADIYCGFSKADRIAVANNIRTIIGRPVDDKKIRRMTRDVFKNFAKYLVDFFRFSKVDAEYIKNHIKIEGEHNMRAAKAHGKGVIALSAHMGNWELGGIVVSILYPPAMAVVLNHKNKKIDKFFTRQRSLGNLGSIGIGPSLRGCYEVLKSNGLLAILGDRDFSKNGERIDFFGKKTVVPKGPAIFSCRIGSVIVPTFMLRDGNDTFRLVMDTPIHPIEGLPEDECIKEMIKRYSLVIESYVRKYPEQWYMFKNVWNGDERDLQPHTGVQ